MENRLIKITDSKLTSLAGMDIPHDWWSRPFEYSCALGFAEPSQVVADMGCGWMYRPFKNALAEIVGTVYAVDANSKLLEQQKPDNMEFIVAPMESTPIADKSCDRVFCISVLEDIQDPIPALKEFARILKDDGRIVITMDIPYDTDKPCPRYPGMNMATFIKAMGEADLVFDGSVDLKRDNAVHHEGWNLCVFRCVLKKQ